MLRLDDGGIYYLELQSSGDSQMPWRMLEYYSLIRQHYNGPLCQQVLYVGDGPNSLIDQIEQDALSYAYQVVDIRTIDCRELLASPDFEDNILALLCN